MLVNTKGLPTWLKKCPCGKNISMNRMLCLVCKEAGLEPVRHAGVASGGDKDGCVLFTSGGIIEMAGYVPFRGSTLKNLLSCIVGRPFLRLKFKGPVVLDDSPVSNDHVEMVFNDADTVDAIGGAGMYAKVCNCRELKILQEAMKLERVKVV